MHPFPSRPSLVDSPSAPEALISLSTRVRIPLAEAYHHWTNFDALPHFMQGVSQLHLLDESRIAWRIRVGARAIAWDAEITEQIPGLRISWESVSGPLHPNAGSVTFEAVHPLSTRVKVSLEFGRNEDKRASEELREAAASCVQWALSLYRDSAEELALEVAA